LTDWLALCREAVDDVRHVLAELPTRADREPVVGKGEGGDETTAIDEAAERAVLARFKGAEGVTFVSEEVGRLGDGRTHVVIDPIDGSLNAKRMLPTHCVSIAVASGDTMEDVELAFVRDFGTGEEFVAHRTGGATLDGRLLPSDGAPSSLEVVGIEAARPEWIAPVAAQLEGSVYRLRVVGSVAITLCYVAAARLDGMITANVCRSVDAAAAQLVAREAGAFVSALGHGGVEAPLGLDARFRVVAARSPEDLETLVQATIAAGVPDE
jgi:myo-inositol-1(or 4)-monophosphatase